MAIILGEIPAPVKQIPTAESLNRESTAPAIDPARTRRRHEEPTPFGDRDAVRALLSPCAKEILALLAAVGNDAAKARARRVRLGPLGVGVELRPAGLARRSARRAKKFAYRRAYSRDSYERGIRQLLALGVIVRVFRRGARPSAYQLRTDPGIWARAMERLQVSCGNHAGLLRQSHPQNPLGDSALRRFLPDGSNGSDGSDKKTTPQPPIENPVEGGARSRSKTGRRIPREGALRLTGEALTARLEELASEARREGLDPAAVENAKRAAEERGRYPIAYFEAAIERIRAEERARPAPSPDNSPDNSALERMLWLQEDRAANPEKYRPPKDLKPLR